MTIASNKFVEMLFHLLEFNVCYSKLFAKIYYQFPISVIIWGIWGYFIVIVERNKTGDVIVLPGIPSIVCKHLVNHKIFLIGEKLLGLGVALICMWVAVNKEFEEVIFEVANGEKLWLLPTSHNKG